MKQIPYARQWINIEDEAAVLETLRSAWLTQGPRVDEFEEALANAVGARYAVAVSNGTAALHLAYLAAGVGPNDLVVTSPITFVATANAAMFCGAQVRFVDIELDTGCLSVEALADLLAAGVHPRVVVPVHYAGLPCDMGALAALQDRYGFAVIEDACHALGAEYKLGRGWGKVGDCGVSLAAVFSFHAIKHVTTGGEGGAVVTNDPAFADRVRRLRSHGIAKGVGPERNKRPWWYEMTELGFNYRLSDPQCALGFSQLRRLRAFVTRRRELAERYTVRLSGLEPDVLQLPRDMPGRVSSWHLYPIQVAHHRDKIYLDLRKEGIETQVHYIPVYLHPYYRRTCGTGPGLCPEAEKFFQRELSLPLYPAMEDSDVDRVCDALEKSLGGEMSP